MPLFNWDDGTKPILKSRFKYYWAIAIPLTLFVLCVWCAAMFLPWGEWVERHMAQIRRRGNGKRKNEGGGEESGSKEA